MSPIAGRPSSTTGGCYSFFLPANGSYTQVQGWLTVFSGGTPAAFSPGSSFPGVGDSVSVWSNSILLWAFVVGTSGVFGCPNSNNGGPPYLMLIGQSNWYCAAPITNSGGATGSIYPTPLFGPAMPFISLLPAPSTSPVEVRICLNQSAANENLYVSAGQMFVR